MPVNSISYAPHWPRPALRVVNNHDWALERRRRGTDDSSVSRTKDELIESSARQINACLQRLDDGAVDGLREPIQRLAEALDALLFDDAPTPQVSLDADDDLQVEWLVGGERLTLVFSRDGVGGLWALDGAGRELLTYEWAAADWPYEAYDAATTFLHRLSAGIRVRVP